MEKTVVTILSNQICTREHFLSSFSKFGHRAVAVLDSQGIFPLTLNNPKFAVLNVLGLHTYFSGTLTHDPGNSFGAAISRSRKHQGNLTERVRRELGLVLRKANGRKDRKDGDYLEFNRNGASYARLLSHMGFHTSGNGSSKADEGTQLPQYLTDLIERFPSFGVDARKSTRKYIRDFVSVVFDTKCTERYREGNGSQLSLQLLTQPNTELVERQGKSVIDAMNIVYPEMEMRHDQLRISTSKGRYLGRIYIRQEQAMNFPQGGNSSGSIETIVRLRPSRYSFD